MPTTKTAAQERRLSDAAERRRYIRLEYVFPVDVYLKGAADGDKKTFIQAFTRDVSLGGLCLSVTHPTDELVSLVQEAKREFDITIEVPFAKRPVEARVKPAWHELNGPSGRKQLLVGVAYEQINERDKRMIVSRSRRMKWLPRVATFLIVMLVCLLTFAAYQGWSLRERNRQLIERFYKAQETSAVVQRGVDKIDAQYAALTDERAKSEERITRLTTEIAALAVAASDETADLQARLEADLASAETEKRLIEDRLAAIGGAKERTDRLYAGAKEDREALEAATLRNMLQWLATHQNKLTGLVISFEGDPKVRNWAFTYDQALAAQAFLVSGERERAVAVLTFFKERAAKKDGGIMNAYNVLSGAPAEDLVRMGPPLWIGIAAVQYTHRTGDKTFLPLAQSVARWAMGRKDKEGGLTGGSDVTWYSTEHNLDAYALFAMLYRITGKDVYRKESRSTLAWIKEHTYSKKDGGMKRGKGDATIATDTFAWAIAAIGPATLAAEGMDPDDIMRYAEEECAVTASFTRPDGQTVTVAGFDFARARNKPRGGIISTEWTAQMVTAFQVMAAHYELLGDATKAAAYRKKASHYLGELDKMVISSPSPSGQGAGCLPYASQASADTGHGWRTPSGSQTGSVAGTAYTIFAKEGYNPLALQ